MDGSDSDECFESADEDFESDQSEGKETCSEENIASKNTCSLEPKNHPKINPVEKPNDTNLQICSKDKSTVNKIEDDSLINTTTEPETNVKEVNLPKHKPIKIPSNQSISQHAKSKLLSGENLDNISKHKDDETDIIIKEKPNKTKSELGNSQKNVEVNLSCDEIKDTITNLNDKHIVESSKLDNPKSEYGIPPKRTVCWFPEVNLPNYKNPISNEKEIEKSSLESIESNKVERRIPLERTECSLPNVNKSENKDILQSTDDNLSDPNDNTPEILSTEQKSELNEDNNLHDKKIKDLRNKIENLKLNDNDNINVSDLNTKIENNNVETTVIKSNLECETKEDKEEVDEDLWGDNEGWGYEESDVLTNENIESAESVKENQSKINLPLISNIVDVADEDENLWNDDDNWGESSEEKDNATKVNTESIHNTLESLSSKSDNSWGGWGNWGISTVLSTAVNITSTVSQGLSNVLETGIGVPDPVELARQHKLEAELYKRDVDNTTNQEQTDGNNSTFGLGNLVSGVSTITKIVETTGTKVISGGLDTLETIGKKTMEVLSENDPGLKRKRAFLKIDQNKPVLSQLLREAKEKAEEENKQCEKRFVKKKANYETIFDDYQGLVHLEALEMLSRQCDIKLQSVLNKTSGEGLNELQETMSLVKELCELPEDDEENNEIENLEDKFETSINDIGFTLNFSKILESWSIIGKSEFQNSNELHDFAIENLAQLTAFSVEQFHKAGELLLVKEHRSTANEADSLVQLTGIFSSLISSSANKFTDDLNKISISDKKEEINGLITNIFFEAANSSRYIVDAFQLLTPVIQVGAIG